MVGVCGKFECTTKNVYCKVKGRGLICGCTRLAATIFASYGFCSGVCLKVKFGHVETGGVSMYLASY